MFLESLPFILPGLIIYFTLNFILRKYEPDAVKRKKSTILGTIILTPIFYLILVVTFFNYLFHETQYDFNKEKWFANKNVRYEMRDHIVNSKILLNLNENQVIDLIGNPDHKTTEEWTYDMGMSSAGLGWQFNTLNLTIKNGKVAEVNKIEDPD